MHLHPHLASERRQGMLAQAGQGTSMTAGMYPVPGWLSFRRIVDIPFGTCLAALESWQRARHDGEVHIGNGQGCAGRSPTIATPAHAGSRSAWPGGRCAPCCA